MNSREMVLWDCIAKLNPNWIFKVLIQVKKSLKFIGFDLTNYVLVFNVIYC